MKLSDLIFGLIMFVAAVMVIGLPVWLYFQARKEIKQARKFLEESLMNPDGYKDGETFIPFIDPRDSRLSDEARLKD